MSGEQSRGSPAGDRRMGGPSVCLGRRGVAWLGVSDHQSLSPFEGRRPSEADKRPQSWASFSFPITAGGGGPACLSLIFPINTPIVILPSGLQAKWPHTEAYLYFSLSPPFGPSTIMPSFSGVPPSLLEFDFPASPGLGTLPPLECQPGRRPPPSPSCPRYVCLPSRASFKGHWAWTNAIPSSETPQSLFL